MIYYASHILNLTQLNYAATEKELFVVVYGFHKFCSYLVGSKVIVYTDHVALSTYLQSKSQNRGLFD